MGAIPIRQADPDLIRHLARIGSNLNQIARHANTEKQLDVQVLQELAKANALLDQLVAQAEQGVSTEFGPYRAVSTFVCF